ncbi:MAG: Alkaline phosphatase [uncultured Thermomicrobiales bacterium]|uniref:Alkaline phosphatase n=1 Tax=uncultured Thermomicrobiales bacterium TaxID=1645740 RepID=A0A6J4TE16_9BACT|nr:MAG: Alkaline phosphatase [uncultured Thermomicrobiales bacterium]
MRPTTLFLILTVLGAALVLGAGTVLAETINCPGFTCQGTDGNDTLRGTTVYDAITGFGGADAISGFDGNDNLQGDDQVDPALDGADTIDGGPGNDLLVGRGGADVLDGGPDNDIINAEERTAFGHPPGIDTIKGGRGNDQISASDGFADVIDCGPGVDEVTFDPGLDTLKHCEIF